MEYATANVFKFYKINKFYLNIKMMHPLRSVQFLLRIVIIMLCIMATI
jgi:hypothetical protein